MSLKDKVRQGRPPRTMSSTEFEANVWGAQDDVPVEADAEPVQESPVEEEGGLIHDEVDLPSASQADLEPVTNRAYRNGDVFYVRSASTYGKFYMVVDGKCGCKGFTYRNTCNHVTHLEKAGYLIFDVRNGEFRVANGGNDYERATKVTTGIRHSLEGAGSEVELRDAQIRRIQNFARAQKKVIREQRRLLAAFRVNSNAGIMRATKLVELAEEEMDRRAAELQTGDLVELDV